MVIDGEREQCGEKGLMEEEPWDPECPREERAVQDECQEREEWG